MPHADSTAESRGTITRSQIELARDVGDVQRGGAAEREDGEAPRIDAAAHRDQPDAFGHVRVDDAIDALGRGHAVDAEPAGDAIDGGLGGAAIEARAAAEEVVGIEEAEHQVGVGHGRLGAAAAIAGRSRLRAGALGPDVQHAAVRRRARSSRRRRRCWRCPGFAAPRAGRRCAGPTRWPPRRRPPARCPSRCRPCRTG